MKVKYLILGGGPTGLGAAYRLKELGESSFLVIDKNNELGGLSRTITDDKGFLWDIGGHIQFSHYEYFTDVMYKAISKDNWLSHEREAWVWLRNQFIPYPFQNNLRFLPKEEIWRCLEGIMNLMEDKNNTSIKNFKDWISKSFGHGIADLFMNPYNFKVWAYPLDSMSFQWIGERVSVLDFHKLLHNIILNKQDVAWGPNNKFEFPLYGGTGAIWTAVGKLIGRNHHVGKTKVLNIDPHEKYIKSASGEKIEYEYLISTIPIDKLTAITNKIPSHILSNSLQLVHSSTNVIGIGLKGIKPEHLKRKCWMYFPENNSPYYRVTVFSNYSPNNVPNPENNWSLMAEVSESEYKPCNRNTLIDQTITAMLEDNLIESTDDIISTWQHFEPYGYPVPSLDRDKILAEVIPFYEQYDIFSRGRFGGWKYEVSNQDHSFMQGVEIANRLVLKEEESTFVNPLIVNKLQLQEDE
jgi:protoporphyrinogen oxidase